MPNPSEMTKIVIWYWGPILWNVLKPPKLECYILTLQFVGWKKKQTYAISDFKVIWIKKIKIVNKNWSSISIIRVDNILLGICKHNQCQLRKILSFYGLPSWFLFFYISPIFTPFSPFSPPFSSGPGAYSVFVCLFCFLFVVLGFT